MKFLIQKIDGQIVHDFTFELLNAINYINWSQGKGTIKYKFLDVPYNGDFEFKEFHQKYIPVGSVEMISAYTNRFYGIIPKPINVPEELFPYAIRYIRNVNYMDMEDLRGKLFIKSNDKIKGYCNIIDINSNTTIPIGNYQVSELIDIESEWRCFVYKGELVSLQNYSGDFTMFPDVSHIKNMINAYKSAPIAYTLDVGVHDDRTFVIECHDFFSCGLYGFRNHNILPYMFSNWFKEYIRKIQNI